jgi:quercetin dioxygenase-like cupin family protein
MAEQVWFLDTLVTLHVPHEEGADGVSVLESRARRGDSPPLHVHGEDEIFHVLGGEVTIRVGGVDHRVGPGASLLAPAGVPHTYRVETDEARWLVVTARGDFERFVRSFSRPAEAPELPEPSGPPTQAQAEALAAASSLHRIELVGPPLH